MLYTRKGDDGTTSAFDSKKGQRMSKSSCQTESLGALDELNSFLGLLKIKVEDISWNVNEKKISYIIGWTQDCLFTIQAEVAGAHKTISPDKITEIEMLVDSAVRRIYIYLSYTICHGIPLENHINDATFSKGMAGNCLNYFEI